MMGWRAQETRTSGTGPTPGPARRAAPGVAAIVQYKREAGRQSALRRGYAFPKNPLESDSCAGNAAVQTGLGRPCFARDNFHYQE